jgi:cytochrome c5
VLLPHLRRGVLAAASSLLLAAGCGFPPTAEAPGPLSPADVAAARTRWPDSSPEALETGRGLFVAKCNRCHGYPDIPKIATDDWPKIIDRMGNKASLSPPEKDAVLHFVLTVAAPK